MAVIVFVDTNIVSLLMRGDVAIRQRWQQTDPASIQLSAIILAEGLAGAYRVRTERYRRVWKHLAEDYAVVPFDAMAADTYAQLRSSLEQNGQMIGDRDCQIAATALAWQATQPQDMVTLVSNNLREFSRVPGLRLADWRQQA